MSERIAIVPSYSLTPSSVVSFNAVYFRNNPNPDGSVDYTRRPPKPNFQKSQDDTPKVIRSFHNFKISDNAYRNLKRKVNWLYFLSRQQSITTYTGKKIFNFRIGFITLTLPSKQRHPSGQITNEVLNPFLTELRKRLGMKNYVWRLEFQKNGNVHYHLVTDTYIDYLFLRKVWNRYCEKLGYVSEYSEAMAKLSLLDYHSQYSASYGSNFNISKVRFAKGKRSAWTEPNSVDVKSVIGEKQISSYISKYFAKDTTGKSICNDLDNAENSKSIRLWFCSRGLSKLKTVTGVVGDMFCNVIDLAKSIKSVRTFSAQYAFVYYLDFKKMSSFVRRTFSDILRNYAFSLGYFSSV